MDRVLVTLRAHGDLTRLELEDGLLRGDLPARLDIESGLAGIDIDIRAEEQTVLGDDGTGPSAVLTISGTADLPSVDEIAELVAEVAVITGAYRVHTTEFGQLEDTWVGRATPGTKLVRFLTGPDSASIETALDELGERLSNGVRHRVLEELLPSPPLHAVVTTRFPTTADLEAAITEQSDGAGDPLDASVSGHLLVFEHRFRADPNHWGADDPAPA